MPAHRHSTTDPGASAVDLLSRRLSDAVTLGSNGDGGNGGNGGSAASARQVAVEVGAAMLADASAGTAEHSDDVVLITEAIGERMGIEGEQAGDLLAAARLHDIGKAWIPTRVLEKAGTLTDDEWELMRQHTVVGERILSSVDELREVARLVRHSHERWDGHGYPDGLAGSEIPMGSRIIFCADAFHAIRCDRPYRAGRSAREAVAEINRCAGTQFDPRVAGALEQVVRERSRRPRGLGGSTRLFALFMCLAILGGGTAVARSGLLNEPPAPPASSPQPPPGCGTAACPTVAGPVGGLAAVPALGGTPGPRALHPGLPGQAHRRHGKGKGAGNGPNHGKSAAAKRKHAGKGRGKSAEHAHGASAGGESGSHGSSGASSSSSSGGGSGGHSSGGHHSSSSHRGSRGSRSHGSSGGSTSSPGNSGGAPGHNK